jgi:hypothetical protein
MLTAAALVIATSALAQQNSQQQPQTPGSPVPQTQGETPTNTQPRDERNTGSPTAPNSTGSKSGESGATGDRHKRPYEVGREQAFHARRSVLTSCEL